MAKDGRVLHTITTPTTKSGDGGTFAPRPVDLAFSPDGTKIAYSYVAYSCPPASSCGTIQRSTYYTDANVTDATPVNVYGNQFSVSDPSWVTNNRTLVFGGYGRQVAIDDLGPGEYDSQPWMVPNGDMGDGEVTRDGTRLAVTSDYGANKTIGFFAVKGDVKTTVPAFPDFVCAFTKTDQNYADPTWAPDGAGIAWASSAGITVSRFTKFAAGDGCELPADINLSPTGSEPDWGPADPPAAAYTPPPPGPGPTPPPVQPGPAPKPIKLAIVKAKGKTVTVTVPSAGKAKLVVTRKGKKLTTATAKAKAAGTLTIKLKKAVRKGLTLKLTFSGKSVSKKL
jgi:hypothetical protein